MSPEVQEQLRRIYVRIHAYQWATRLSLASTGINVIAAALKLYAGQPAILPAVLAAASVALYLWCERQYLQAMLDWLDTCPCEGCADWRAKKAAASK
jgi:hypothetical protein